MAARLSGAISMGSNHKIAALTALICSAAAGAQAHPGSKILTTGSGERSAMTAGMSYEDVKGVHIFRGRPAETKNAQATKREMHKQVEIEISMSPIYRRFRHLRTQGFYSGDAYPSRHYTHGFYSGR